MKLKYDLPANPPKAFIALAVIGKLNQFAFSIAVAAAMLAHLFDHSALGIALDAMIYLISSGAVIMAVFAALAWKNGVRPSLEI